MIFSQFWSHIYHAYAFIFGTSLLHLFLSPLWRNGFRNLLTTTWSIMTMAVESVNHHPPISTLISLHLFFIIIKKKKSQSNNKNLDAVKCCHHQLCMYITYTDIVTYFSLWYRYTIRSVVKLLENACFLFYIFSKIF